MSSVSQEVANLLIDLKCVQLNPKEPFVYASGLKGPIYCDNRKTLSHVEARSVVRDAFVDLIKNGNFKYDQIAGMATAGIAHAAFVADAMGQPMVYVRSKPKGHGKQNQLEGDYASGQKLLLIEDLVNQGKSLAEGVEGVRNAGLEVETCFSIVDYEMDQAKQRLSGLGIKLVSLTTFSDLVAAGKEKGLLDDESVELLKSWQRDPSNWSL